MPLFRFAPAAFSGLGNAAVLRPVLALGITQIIGFGSIYYAFGVLVGPMSADLGLGPTLAYALLSGALLLGSLAAPLAGRLVDRHGARRMMALGSLAAAAGLVALSQAQGAVSLALALLLVEAVGPLVLYDAAFAALAQALGPARARRAITLMTMIGGFASTVFWPLTLALAEAWGWRAAYLSFAALHLALCLPLHMSLPRMAAPEPTEAAGTAPGFAPLPAAQQPRAMVFLALGLSLSWAVMSAFSAQWVPALAALGVAQGTAVAAGALMGPAQVTARVIEMIVAGDRHPMLTALAAFACLCAAIAVLALAPVGLAATAVFAVLFGIGQGLATMVRGTVPLALFGIAGYAARLGRLGGLRMFVSALAPFGMAAALAAFGPSVTLGLAGLFALAALGAMLAVPWRGQSMTGVRSPST